DYYFVVNDTGALSLTDSAGVDTIDLSMIAVGGATVVLQDTTGSVTTTGGTVDIVGAIDNILGTNANDSITGNSLPNRLFGLAGDDVINGGAGDDYIDGGAGSDTLNGGTGNDFIVIKPGSTETVSDTGGIDTLDFSHALRGITINLASNGSQVVDTEGNRVQLLGTIENI